MRIVDNAGRPVPAGITGRVQVAGPTYWPAFTYLHHSAPATFPLDVGDLGYVDVEGHLFLTGRSSEVIISGGVNIYPAQAPRETFMYSAMYAASQNLVVAARALGLGAAFTTLHGVAEPKFREILGIPDDRTIGVTIPLGWPAGPVGPVTRKPLDEVVHRGRW